MVDGYYCYNNIRQKDAVQDCQNQPAGSYRYLILKGMQADIGLNHSHGKSNDQAPDQREFQTDVAMEIEGLIRIIPPSCMKELIQQKTGDQLDHCRKDHTADKEDP